MATDPTGATGGEATMPPGMLVARRYARRGFDAAVGGWRWVFHRSAFTTVAVLLAALILFWLPQTQHLLWQLPAVGGLRGTELVLSGLFALFITILAAGFLAGILPARRAARVDPVISLRG